MGTCQYFHKWKYFAPNRTYETHKQCTTCGHVVDKEEFPDKNCYCCASRYRVKYRKSMETRKQARIRARQKRNNNSTQEAIELKC
jgi:hypothetical protein